MKNKINNIKTVIIAVLISSLTISSCSLEEDNPGGFTLEATAKSEEGYRYLLNQCYFGMQRYFYGTDNWMTLTEGGTDLWTYQANKSTTWTQWFWYFGGASPNTSYTANWWNGTYDGIGSCNTAIRLAHLAPFKTEEERNAAVAEAHFLRAIYYFNAVEQFGGVTVITEENDPAGDVDFKPERVDPLTVYKTMIIPDLEFASKWLPVGDHALNSTPSMKSAIGFLAKAYLQTVQYDPSKEYAAKALQCAELLIKDAEGGGAQYNAHLYPTYEEVFDENNNWTNKEALWKHRWYAGADGHGSSNGNYKLNRNNEYFYCKVNNFGARVDNQETRITWGGNPAGMFMPTQHLLSLYIQEDGSLDPRFHQSFQTEWNANIDYKWDEGTLQKYDKVSSIKDVELVTGNLAIKFIMPQDADYATEASNKHQSKYLVIDYKDVYDDANKKVLMRYAYDNPTGNYKPDGTSENLFNFFYPSLNKHNSSRFYVANASKQRNGNLNSTFMMRMAEVYLIAAEADIYVNGGSTTLQYINKVRERAGAKALTATPDIRMVLDERGRELCGEYSRFYDLKRTGMLKDDKYLKETHPDLGQFFKPEYAVRPIPLGFINILDGGGAYYQNPGY